MLFTDTNNDNNTTTNNNMLVIHDVGIQIHTNYLTLFFMR